MRFIENSPVFQADRVQTPVLMLANDGTTRCPGIRDRVLPWHSGDWVRKLHVELHGEPHGLPQTGDMGTIHSPLQQFFRQ